MPKIKLTKEGQKIPIPDDAIGVIMHCETMQAYSPALVKEIHRRFFNALGGHDDFLRKRFVAGFHFRVQFDAPTYDCYVEFR